ncbi:MAG: NTP transferase domain-containing protein [Candidatus Omnitrophica bacterium]|nr:NTP transferase domain-containing protein [Candidatus Omnitrophota bacterium]
MKNNHFASIMAGGQGTRFWPWSTAEKPKQFLTVVGDQPLITQTYRRLLKFIAKKNIFVIADGKYFPAVQDCLPGFPKSNFIAEPAPRNTAPALMQANIFLSKINPQAHLLVVPADHFIAKESIFAEQLTAALEYSQNRCVITAGIKPSEPHTGYGYIQFSEKKPQKKERLGFYPIVQFKEKPDNATAAKYLRKGNYYWNSGMFVYKLAYFKEFLKNYSPYYHIQYEKLEKTAGNAKLFAKTYKSINPESIDYALMEKLKEAVMFKAAFAWNDVGSWSSVYEMNEKNRQKNVCRGRTIAIDTRNSLLFSNIDKPMAVIGLDKVAVINTENGILIAPISQLQQVKQVIEILKKDKK